MNYVLRSRTSPESGVAQAVALALSIAFFAMLAFVPLADAAILRSLDRGSSGADVTALQQYLAGDPSLYPEGLVTGYYGSLTLRAVERFQCRYAIVCAGTPASTGYGRVGPVTLAKLNELMGGIGGAENAPIIGSVRSTPVVGGATIQWTTNELATGVLYYDQNPLTLREASGPGTEPFISGVSTAESGMNMNHAIGLNSLLPRTTYYFTVVSRDANGNMQLIWPQTFTTL